jgi:hypothetical protein
VTLGAAAGVQLEHLGQIHPGPHLGFDSCR